MTFRFSSLFVCSLTLTALITHLAGEITFQKIADNSTLLPDSSRGFKGFWSTSLRGDTVAFSAEEFPGKNIPELTHYYVQQAGKWSEMAVNSQPLAPGHQLGILLDTPLLIRADGSVIFEALDYAPVAGISTSFLAKWQNGSFSKFFDEADVSALLQDDGMHWFSNPAQLTEDGRIIRQMTLDHPETHLSETVLVQKKDDELSILAKSDDLPSNFLPGQILLEWSAFRDGLVYSKLTNNTQTYRLQNSEAIEIGTAGNSFPGIEGPIFMITSFKSSQRLIVMSAVHQLGGNNQAYGFYGWSGGHWFTIAEDGMEAPGGGVYDDLFANPVIASLDNDSFVFEGLTSLGVQRAFLYHQGVVTPILTTGQVIDGSPLSSFSIFDHSLSGSRMVFTASFASGAQRAVYVADLSSLMTDTSRQVPVNIEVAAGSKINLTAADSRDGYTYYLHRSTDLKDWSIVDQKTAASGGLLFEREVKAADGDRAFFRIEEVKR